MIFENKASEILDFDCLQNYILPKLTHVAAIKLGLGDIPGVLSCVYCNI